MGNVLSDSEFEEILRKVKEALDKMEPMYGQMSSNIHHNPVYFVLPPPVKDKIKEWLGVIWDWIKKITIEVGKFFALPGRPWTLYTHGESWTKDIGATASGWQDAIHVSQLKTDDEWKGAAATAYKDILPLHQKALGAVKSATDEVQDMLTKLAVAIGVMWVAIAAAIVSFIWEFGTAVAAALTGVGILAALGAAAASCAKLWGVIVAAFAAIEAFVVSTLVPAFTDLQQRIAQNDGFPHGHWPTLTKDISNSSMHGTDDDPSTDDIPWEMSKA
jgi:hypothetical protein